MYFQPLLIVNLGQWLGLLGLIVSLVILWQIRQLLLLLFAAIVLAIALNSLAKRLQKAGISRSLSVLLSVGIAVLVSVLFISLIVPPFIGQFARLIGLFPPTFALVFSWVEAWIDRWLPWFPAIELPRPAELAQQLQPLAENVLRNFFAIFSNSLSVLLEIFLVTVLTLMLVANPQGYRKILLRLFPSFYRRRADEILNKCEVALGNWMAGVVISSSSVALMSAVGLWVLQVDFVLANALLAGLLNLIPNLGPTLSVIFPLMVAIQDTAWKAIAVLILYLVIQQLESYLLTPTVMEKQISLLPAFTLSAQIIFASFFGFLGLLLALPLTVVAKTWFEEALVKDVLDHWDTSPQTAALPALPVPLPEPIISEELPPPDVSDDASET